MTDQEIALAKARANDVINGFMQVRITQARDVVKLAEALQDANRRLREIDIKPDRSPSGTGDFGQYFSEFMRGKGG